MSGIEQIRVFIYISGIFVHEGSQFRVVFSRIVPLKFRFRIRMSSEIGLVQAVDVAVVEKEGRVERRI